MSKRQRQESDDVCEDGEQARLGKLRRNSDPATTRLPSPDSSVQNLKDLRADPCVGGLTNIDHHATGITNRENKTAVLPAETASKSKGHKDRVSYWVYEDARLPPSELYPKPPEMTSKGPLKRGRSELPSESTQPLSRHARLKARGIFMHDARNMSEASQKFCKSLLEDVRPPAGLPVYLKEHRYAVQLRTAARSEAFVQRDILPTVVPSIDNIKLLNLERFAGIDLEPFTEEISADWIRTNAMGGKRPKPDYVVGLLPEAFDPATWYTLSRYSTPDTPVLHSPGLCYPLLVAEAKSSAVGVLEAVRQAAHAAAIAVNSQIQLHWRAYGKSHATTEELYGKPLVFSVCHSPDDVQLSAHYALYENGQLRFYYSRVQYVILTMNNGRDQDLPNTFVENVYKICGPLHLQRLRAAANTLREKEEEMMVASKQNEPEEEQQEAQTQASTGVSFGASCIDLEDDQASALETSQDSQLQNVFKRPRLPTKVLAGQALEDIEQQLKDSKEREQRLEARHDALMEMVAYLSRRLEDSASRT